jgi:hypothetical protein
LVDMGFAVKCPLARHRSTPQIRFLDIGLHVCFTLPSDPISRRRPCASRLHLHQVIKGTLSFKLLSMLGTQEAGGEMIPARQFCCVVVLWRRDSQSSQRFL